MSEIILREFDEASATYSRVTEKVASLIRELLVEYSINVHSVTSRTKSRISLEKKLARPDRSYQELREITDICGIRIITYFDKDVDRVVEVLEKEFDVDRLNSVDKRENAEADRFGYVSIHHVLRLKPSRSGLQEYRWIDGRCFEIQTRSILQHAWAEIEHDLGYKSKTEVPKTIRRRFSRLAGLLELADTEFDEIREQLEDYEKKVIGKIKTEPEVIEINRSSLIAFAKSSETVSYLDRKIAKIANWQLDDNKENVAAYAEFLSEVGIANIEELSANLDNHKELIIKFAENWLDASDVPRGSIHRGISIFYLLYILIAKTKDKARIEEHFAKRKLSPAHRSRIVDRVIKVFGTLA